MGIFRPGVSGVWACINSSFFGSSSGMFFVSSSAIFFVCHLRVSSGSSVRVPASLRTLVLEVGVAYARSEASVFRLSTRGYTRIHSSSRNFRIYNFGAHSSSNIFIIYSLRLVGHLGMAFYIEHRYDRNKSGSTRMSEGDCGTAPVSVSWAQ